MRKCDNPFRLWWSERVNLYVVTSRGHVVHDDRCLFWLLATAAQLQRIRLAPESCRWGCCAWASAEITATTCIASLPCDLHGKWKAETNATTRNRNACHYFYLPLCNSAFRLTFCYKIYFPPSICCLLTVSSSDLILSVYRLFLRLLFERHPRSGSCLAVD